MCKQGHWSFMELKIATEAGEQTGEAGLLAVS